MEKVLVIDDEQKVRDMLSQFLSDLKYKVYTTTSGKKALSFIDKERPHIIFLGIKVSDMDGIACLKQIKKIDTHIGVIMIAKSEEEKAGIRAIGLGAFDYIIKPFDLEYLQEVLLMKLTHLTSSLNQ